MYIGIHGKNFNKKGRAAVEKIFSLLENHIPIRLSPDFSEVLKKKHWDNNYPEYVPGDLNDAPEYLLSLGGDGTILDTITHFGSAQPPVLGINMGRLGYLATTSINDIEGSISALIRKDYELDERVLLHLDSGNIDFQGLNFALNDFTILKSNSSSMITVKASVDGEFLNTYWADGIIVASPTGSTGYSLSCGGPIVMPHSNNFIITPVAPHNLTIRPLVISGDSEITFEIGGRSKHALVSMDSRSAPCPHGSRLTIRKESFNARLIKLKGSQNFETLRQKLNWGLDARN